MDRKIFKDDNYGQVFSLDVMIALIIVTVILGVSADAMDMASYKTQDYSLRFSLERTTTDAADILVKSPGSPDNWENCSDDVIPGLAENKEVPNKLSFFKILKLKSNYNQFICGKILPKNMNSSMIIYPENPSLKPFVIMDDKAPPSACEVAVANRTVLCDFMHITVVIEIKRDSHLWPTEQERELEICPHNDHNQPDLETRSSGWTCHHFNVTIYDLNSTDFYIITDPVIVTDSARWGIDRADNQMDCKEKFTGGPLLVNDKINAMLGNDTSAVLWFHILTNGNINDGFDSYIIGVPKGTPLNQVKLDYVGPQPCFFVLKVWY